MINTNIIECFGLTDLVVSVMYNRTLCDVIVTTLCVIFYDVQKKFKEELSRIFTLTILHFYLKQLWSNCDGDGVLALGHKPSSL